VNDGNLEAFVFAAAVSRRSFALTRFWPADVLSVQCFQSIKMKKCRFSVHLPT